MDKMKPLLESFTDQLRDALKIAQEARIKSAEKEIHNIVLSGMGGSGVAGNLVASLCQDALKVPMLISKSYDIPAFINENTLFLASSFSGNTEETNESLQKALKAGAQCVVITSGGKIAEIAAKNSLDIVKAPDDLPSPRAHFGYSTIPLMYILHYKGLLDTSFVNQTESLIGLLEKEQEDIRHKAERIANGIKGYLPIVYSDSRVYPIAVRMLQQLAQNGKHLGHANEFPEMNYNELVGWEHPEQVLNDSKVLFLKTDYDHPRVRERFKLSRDIFSKKAANILDLQAKGQSLLEQCFYLINLTDWVSYFLAIANNTDPFPIQAIDQLKDELAKE